MPSTYYCRPEKPHGNCLQTNRSNFRSKDRSSSASMFAVLSEMDRAYMALFRIIQSIRHIKNQIMFCKIGVSCNSLGYVLFLYYNPWILCGTRRSTCFTQTFEITRSWPWSCTFLIGLRVTSGINLWKWWKQPRCCTIANWTSFLYLGYI